MERRGFIVATADGGANGMAGATDQPPAFAVVDMRLGDGRGFDVVSALRQARPGARIVMLTGYGNIATAVAAVKAGAIDYLPKPADADAVERALLALEGETPEPPEDPMSADRVRWEHIQRIFELCERNVSETARRLEMHRRTLLPPPASPTPRARAARSAAAVPLAAPDAPHRIARDAAWGCRDNTDVIDLLFQAISAGFDGKLAAALPDGRCIAFKPGEDVV